jgi:hypothetical protein
VSENLSLPEDITALSVEQLDQFVTAAMQRFNTLFASESTELSAQVAEANEMKELSDAIKSVRLEKAKRTEAAAQTKTEAKKLMAELAAEEKPLEEAADEPELEPEPEPVAASARPQGGAKTNPVQKGKFRNPSLADAQRNAPPANVPRPQPVLTASADIPGFAAGSKLDGMEHLVSAMTSRARHMPITQRGMDAPRIPIASLMREHKFTLGPDSSLAEFNEVMTAAANPDILVAAGGWCSPSEIS